jgi:chromatin assembly factor 1 subunit A
MSNRKLSRRGFRRKPKTNIVKELKLLGSDASDSMMYPKTDATNQGPEKNCDKSTDEMKVSISNEVAGQSNQVPIICIIKKKLLQFDKSHRPAYYGTWSKKR